MLSREDDEPPGDDGEPGDEGGHTPQHARGPVDAPPAGLGRWLQRRHASRGAAADDVRLRGSDPPMPRWPASGLAAAQAQACFDRPHALRDARAVLHVRLSRKVIYLSAAQRQLAPGTVHPS